MSQTGFIWIVIVAACVAANLPFLNHRILALGPVRAPRKALWMRLIELLVFYFAVGGLALVLEGRVGQVAPQGWEFYAVTAALFLTLAFPGFVYRYLLRRR
ncbi:MAG: hypothetical protein QG643_354 [Pseudomonadota bacterium]|nr:hypothetical protein [Pseudomonadota bacterium]